ncbi:MAG: septum formation protein Maf [Chloroflexi bacterium RBG_16_58_14]|nr:MAG: septum formation protein Maf [Chloroflexi bacterium RBG_16_58_14]
MSLVLASNSPRRRQLLALGGWVFRVMPATVDESPQPGEDAQAYVLRLAISKAQDVAARAGTGDVVVAADTTVVDGGDILGKPANPLEAETMLRRLRGKTHPVFTALAVLRVSDGALLTDWCVTDVPMRDYNDAEMAAYIASGDPLDKAGAYAIQHSGFNPVVGVRGCYANVMGLPLCHLIRTLARLDIHPHTDLPQRCQDELQYDCPVFSQVLKGKNQG